MIVNAPARKYPIIFTEKEETSIISCIATLENMCKVMEAYKCGIIESGSPGDPTFIDKDKILNTVETLKDMLDIHIMF